MRVNATLRKKNITHMVTVKPLLISYIQYTSMALVLTSYLAVQKPKQAFIAKEVVCKASKGSLIRRGNQGGAKHTHKQHTHKPHTHTAAIRNKTLSPTMLPESSRRLTSQPPPQKLLL